MIKNVTTAARTTGPRVKVLDKLKGLCYIVTSVTQNLRGIEMEKDKDRMIHIRLSPELHKRLRHRVVDDDTSIQEWVAALRERELKRTKSK